MSILSSHERSVIQTLLAVHYSIRAIARFLKRSPTTIASEIKRVSPYNAETAQQLAKGNMQRRVRHNSLTPEIATHELGIAFKTNYNWIDQGLLSVGLSDFPDQGNRRKRSHDGRHQVFAHGHSIEQRPKAVALRQ